MIYEFYFNILQNPRETQNVCFRVINVTQIERNEFQGRLRVQSRHAMQNPRGRMVECHGRGW